MRTNKILLITDRDGTLIHNNQSKCCGLCYVLDTRDVEFIDGVLPALKRLKDEIDPYFAMVTRQECIQKGIASMQEVNKVNAYILGRIHRDAGIDTGFNAVNVAWGVEDKVIGRIAQITNTIYRICYTFIPDHIWLIDDSESGIKAAQALGIMSVHIQSQYATDQETVEYSERTYKASSFAEAAEIVISMAAKAKQPVR